MGKDRSQESGDKEIRKEGDRMQNNRWAQPTLQIKSWIPAPNQVEGRLFAGMTIVAGMTYGWIPAPDRNRGQALRGDDR